MLSLPHSIGPKTGEITLCGEESTAGRVGLARDRRRAKVILSPVVKPQIGVASGFEKNLGAEPITTTAW